MPVRCATPYYSVVLNATLGIAQSLNPAIKATLSNNGHTLTLYNISESDIGQITIVSPDGKSNQNIHFERLSVYFADQSIVDPIRVYGLNDIVGQTYRQEEGSAYTKLSRETTFQPWLNLDIPRLTDDLSEIGNKLGVSQSTRGQPKLYSVRLGNASDSDTAIATGVGIGVPGSVAAGYTAYKYLYPTTTTTAPTPDWYDPASFEGTTIGESGEVYGTTDYTSSLLSDPAAATGAAGAAEAEAGELGLDALMM